ncbi:MAG TPA: type III-A CRISPR-associated protein Cas10/Csm1, partial [Stellaceae bacterium]|nr:type III-A CRISPR-associated protein Cas10/Csm1 [Stellaceae bacterium]
MSQRRELPNCDEVALGAFLHDIGKFMQRAFGALSAMAPRVRERERDVLPQFDGRSTHWHALWSDAFLDWIEREKLPWPEGVDPDWVRDCAVYHHKPLQNYAVLPGGAATWLIAEADRIAAGMERKSRDVEQEAAEDPPTRDAYRRTALAAITPRIAIGQGAPAECDQAYPLQPLAADSLMPAPRRIAETEMIPAYSRMWPEFQSAYAAMARSAAGNIAAFHEGLAALCETYLWAIPSSTIDDPDVGLYDHARATAAVAACLYRHHEFMGDLADEGAVRDRERHKFRFCIGDLSGIQRTLFRLRSEQVSGLARLLRGRSLRFQLIAEACVRRLLAAFSLPPYAALQTAGGRFLLLLPFTDDRRQADLLHCLRAEIDRWMRDEYVGELALNIALTEPFAAADLLDSGRAKMLFDKIGLAAEQAKMRALSTVWSEPVVMLSFDPHLGESAICPACGVRPAVRPPTDRAQDAARCRACTAEARLGQRWPKAVAVEIGEAHAADDRLFGVAIRLAPRDDKPGLSGWRLRGMTTGSRPAGERFGGAYVARFPTDPAGLQKYQRLRDEGDEVEADQIKTFAAMALDAQEKDVQGRLIGRAMLALVKADVDRLGSVFSQGLGKRYSLARIAALSRLVDAFFTGFLPDLIERSFPNLYTVYAGGDDLLLIGPWHQAMRFALELRWRFDEFSGHNPNLTLSAGIALFDPKTPVSRAAAEAEKRLEKAKDDGRDRIHAILAIAGPAIGWEAFAAALGQADALSEAIRAGAASTALLHRLLSLDDRRRRAEE